MKRLLTFIAICYSISALAAVIFYLLCGQLQSIAGTLFASAYMFIPLISVVITQLIFHEKPLRECGINFHFNKWWIVAWLIMPLICLASVGISLLFPNTDWNSAVNAQLPITLLLALVAGPTANAIAAMGEETAWRGYISHLLETKSFGGRSLLIGIIWGVWHAPLVLMGLNYPNHPVWGVGMMILLCLLMSPLMLFIRERSGSTIAAAIAHGTLNATAGLALIALTNYQPFLMGMTGVAGMIVVLVADIAIVIEMKCNKTMLQH